MEMKYLRNIVCALLCCLVLGAGFTDASAAPRRKKKAKTEQKDTVKKVSAYEKLLKGEKLKDEGFITVHLKDGKVYFEMPDSVFGRNLIMGSTVKSISNNADAVVGSKNDLIHFTFTRRDTTVLMRRLNSSYVTDDGNIKSALSKSKTSFIMNAFPIKAWNADSTACVVDVTEVFLSDDKELAPFSDYGVNASYKRSESFKKNLSFITGAKSFDDNLSVSSSVTYNYTLTNPVTGKKIVDKKNITAELNRSILLLPEEIYHPRTADPRIGYFFTRRNRYGSLVSTSDPVWYVNRWRLEPSDTAAYRAGQLVEPVKPITFYIDSDFPQWWKPYIKSAVEQWNEVFEEIGFKNAIRALDFPEDDPDFDPENIKYSCIRYAPIGVQNAMGPSWVDPRSGEIINASVYVYHDVIRLISKWMYVQTAQADERVRSGRIPEELLGDALNYVIRHEVGHTLGLMHNMSASSVIPVDSLRSPSYTCKHGTTTSIMDYARFNYVAQPGDFEKGVKLTPPTFGSYDRWAIRWGYQPVFDVDSFEKETEITTDMISDSLKADAFYRYGKQQFYAVFFDPSCQNEDLGDDVVKASSYGIDNLRYIMDNFMDWIPDDEDRDYSLRTDIYKAIMNQYLLYMNHLAMNVGGIYRYEVLACDAQNRFANIPGSKQRECLDFLMNEYRTLDWFDNKKALSRLPVIGKPSFAIRDAITSLILITPYLTDKTDGISTEEFSLEDCMDRVFNFVWKRGKLTPESRRLQNIFVQTYMDMAGFKSPEGKKEAINICEDEHCCMLGLSMDGHFPYGEFKYDPVSGFEWLPRTIFSTGRMNSAFVYAVLSRAYDFMEKARLSANETDRAHYALLMDQIAYSLKNVSGK